MCGSKELLRAYYYNGLPYQSNPPTDDEKTWYDKRHKFFEALEHLERFEVRLGRLAKIGVDANGKSLFQQKRVDLMLGVDMALLAAKGRISTIALLTGDSDYVPAVEAVKREGVSIILWHGALKGEQPPSRDLFKICDERYDISTIIQKSLREEQQQPAKATGANQGKPKSRARAAE